MYIHLYTTGEARNEPIDDSPIRMCVCVCVCVFMCTLHTRTHTHTHTGEASD